MENLSNEIFAGIVAIILGSGIILNRLGLLHFGKNNHSTRTCFLHSELMAKVDQIHDKQLINIQQHAESKKQLVQGRDEFKEIQKSLSKIEKSVAVLLDRSEREKAIKDTQ